MAADLDAVSHAFVSALASKQDARDEMYAARHPHDPQTVADVINRHTAAEPPVTAADVPELLPLLARHVAEARAEGQSHIRADMIAGSH